VDAYLYYLNICKILNQNVKNFGLHKNDTVVALKMKNNLDFDPQIICLFRSQIITIWVKLCLTY
jgi:hypothetical protein